MSIISPKRRFEMKKILLPIIMILASTLFIAVMPTDAEAAIYEDTVRLHILANSNSTEDQALKLALRDSILDRYGKTLSAFESIEDAERELSDTLVDIEAFADSKIKELGYDYKTDVTLTNEWYETRQYESFSLPCGYYSSLKIVIGEGAGENWWCVMYPPLCLDAATSSKSYSDAEELLISKKYNVKFKVLELISEIAR